MKDFIYTTRVYHDDVDYMGVMYNAHYLVYMERARSEWLVALGIDQAEIIANGNMFVLVSAELKFQRPARFADCLEISTHLVTLVKLGAASFILEQRIRRKSDQELLCTGIFKVAYIDRKFKPSVLPKNIKLEMNRGS